ncbi:MAG: 50S ribosomal protein L1 [Canidatus Methanoxibalbensis ujae]|nr:50S ribosomal protein L1 [Candidatus Methanoxibalbensis ujae]MCW7078184.1 50S ribosomal protein L1 [Candidatus Methanoxibalbensis ujae]RLG36354.1 MAG: 50S ribosomal protein L1 [Methanosarcinales archaeon]
MEVEEIEEAVKKALESRKPRRFVESVDIVINLKDIDLKQPKNRLNLRVLLPHPPKDMNIGAFAKGELALKAKEAGADVIEEEELKKTDKKKARKIASEYDFLIASAELMPQIGRSLGVIFGPRDKMPEPIPPSADPAKVIERLKRTVKIRSKSNTIWVKVGNENMSPREIAENAYAVIRAIEANLEKGWQNIGSIYVKTTMGKAVRIWMR